MRRSIDRFRQLGVSLRSRGLADFTISTFGLHKMVGTPVPRICFRINRYASQDNLDPISARTGARIFTDTGSEDELVDTRIT